MARSPTSRMSDIAQALRAGNVPELRRCLAAGFKADSVHIHAVLAHAQLAAGVRRELVEVLIEACATPGDKSERPGQIGSGTWMHGRNVLAEWAVVAGDEGVSDWLSRPEWGLNQPCVITQAVWRLTQNPDRHAWRGSVNPPPGLQALLDAWQGMGSEAVRRTMSKERWMVMYSLVQGGHLAAARTWSESLPPRLVEAEAWALLLSYALNGPAPRQDMLAWLLEQGAEAHLPAVKTFSLRDAQKGLGVTSHPLCALEVATWHNRSDEVEQLAQGCTLAEWTAAAGTAVEANRWEQFHHVWSMAPGTVEERAEALRERRWPSTKGEVSVLLRALPANPSSFGRWTKVLHGLGVVDSNMAQQAARVMLRALENGPERATDLVAGLKALGQHGLDWMEPGPWLNPRYNEAPIGTITCMDWLRRMESRPESSWVKSLLAQACEQEAQRLRQALGTAEGSKTRSRL
jgi:hypothetical protein